MSRLDVLKAGFVRVPNELPQKNTVLVFYQHRLQRLIVTGICFVAESTVKKHPLRPEVHQLVDKLRVKTPRIIGAIETIQCDWIYPNNNCLSIRRMAMHQINPRHPHIVERLKQPYGPGNASEDRHREQAFHHF